MRTFLMGCLLFAGTEYQRLHPESEAAGANDKALETIISAGIVLACIQDLREIMK